MQSGLVAESMYLEQQAFSWDLVLSSRPVTMGYTGLVQTLWEGLHETTQAVLIGLKGRRGQHWWFC